MIGMDKVFFVSKENGYWIEIPGNDTLKIEEGKEQVTITAGNYPGAELPKSGGAGTALYTTLGAILSGTAGAILLLSRRKKTV